MDKNVALKIAKRFICLPLEKRTLYLEKMLQEGVSPANLPIPQTRDEFADALPLSFAQDRQWFVWQMDPHSAAYNIPTALHLRGTLDVPALERAFNAVIARHDSLRTTFGQDDEGAVQVIHAQLPMTIAIDALDVAAEPLLREQQIQAYINEQLHLPFDLQTGPLLRASLLRLADDDHVLAVTVHHIAADGWSMRVMVEELVQLYSGFAQGREVSLDELPIQYADYAIWQRHWMEAGERERQLAYWKEQLGSDHSVLQLPTDFPRPSVQSFRGQRLDVTFDNTLAAGLKSLAQREGLTVFMVLLASFQALLHRYSGQAEISVGVPNANRNRVETERLIGFFVNTQVLKARIDPQASFRSLLQQVKQSAVGAQAHQELPFEQLVEALQPERSLSHSPLFQVMFNHQNLATGESQQGTRLPGLQINPLTMASQTAQFDLSLDTFETPQGLGAQLTFASDLFTAATIERMAVHWQNLLQAVLVDAAQPLAELRLLDADEREVIVSRWNATATEYPLERSVHALIEEQVRATPDACALVFGEQRLSYAQLNARANQLAAVLIEHGVGPEVLVGISVERSLEMVVGLLAILKAGGAYLPLDPEYPQDRLAYMFDDSGIALLLTQSHLLAQLPVPNGLRSLVLDQDGDWLQGRSEANPELHIDPENLAYVIYTSGSTGKPKGAGNRHSALVNR
ncbi:condensation domain-containing protein, partial [Pseudomonas sp. GM80]|uniref:condensation domain-containing protein n=1 Tax=Pseudomonas sp. GM80 TaxID=1144339 RepID=UPI00026F4E1F